ncbi:MAG: hypothetical protein ACRC4P_03590 [Aeromonas sp.]
MSDGLGGLMGLSGGTQAEIDLAVEQEGSGTVERDALRSIERRVWRHPSLMKS